MDVFLLVRQKLTAETADGKIKVRCWVESFKRVMRVIHSKTDDKGRWHLPCHLLGSEVTSTWRAAWAQPMVSWRGKVGDSNSQAPLDHTVTLCASSKASSHLAAALPSSTAGSVIRQASKLIRWSWSTFIYSKVNIITPALEIFCN